jgi:membrane protein YdbS with pleckstrin-like domain
MHGPRTSNGADGLKGIERYLAHGERVVFVLRRHTVVLERPVSIWLLALAAGVGAGLLSPHVPGWDLGAVGGWIVLAGAALLAWKAWGWWTARYVITDERVLLIEGVVARRVRAVPLSKVTHTDYRRTFFGRIFGYGTLTLDSPGGASGLRELTNIPKPDEVYRLIMSLVAGTSSRPRPGLTVGAPVDPLLEDTGPMPRLIL